MSKVLNEEGSSVSFWMEVSVPNFERLKTNAEADVCIIGGGFVGLLTAYELAKAGKSVIVLEDGPLTGGATGKTTAHLTNILDDRYFDIIHLFGEDGAKKAAKSHALAVDHLEKIIHIEKIACNFERVDAYLFCPPGESKSILEKESEACLKAGISNEFIDKTPFPHFDTGKALHFKNQAQFHPLQFLAGIVDKLIEKGVKIYNNTHAAKISEGKSDCSIETSDGFNVKCHSVVVATNVPINDRVYIHTKQAAYRSYAIAGKIPKNYLPSALYYDTPDPYHYLRIFKLEDADLLIVGGEDHRTGQNDNPENCYSRLEKWTRKRIPVFEEVIYKWSGQIIEPVDSLAFLGKNPGNERIFVATGDSGNGLTHGTIAALLITDLILSKANLFEELYRPSRKNIKALKEYISENANTALQYKDWLINDGEENTILPGEGKVVGKGICKKAVYKDEHGCIHRTSAICPHLEGIVRWNKAEKTWDCPCHGSRFDPYGKVINGPANSNLKNDNDKN